MSASRLDVGLAQDLAQTESSDLAKVWILCPWLEQFSTESEIWLSVLAAHDVNEGLLRALSVSRNTWRKVYAGVFAVDTLRPQARFIRRLKGAGIAGVINFPSISFIDGDAGAVFEGLSLGVNREIDFLHACSSAGLRIAGVTKSAETARRLIAMGVDFLIVHGGPPTRDNSDPGRDVALEVQGIAREDDVPVISISSVIKAPRGAQCAASVFITR
jgi:predicted TIM-barrel enzyme